MRERENVWRNEREAESGILDVTTSSVIDRAYVKLEGADNRAGPEQVAWMQDLESKRTYNHKTKRKQYNSTTSAELKHHRCIYNYTTTRETDARPNPRQLTSDKKRLNTDNRIYYKHIHKDV